LRVGGLREPNLFSWDDSIEFEVIYQWDSQAVSRLCQDHGVLPQMLIGFRFENSQGWVITNFASAMLPDQSFEVELLGQHECVVRCRVSPMKLASGHYFVSPGIAIGILDNLFPVKEYTNLIHLYCDTSIGVIGQMQMDYTMEILELA